MGSRVRVAVIITGLGVGGTELSLLSLLEHIDRSRYECDVICLYDEDNRLIPRFLALGIHVTVIKLFDYTKPPFFKYSRYGFLQLVHLLRKNRYDVVHTILPQANRSGAVAALLAGIRAIVSTVCNMAPVPPRGVYRALDRMLGNRGYATVCKSPALLEYDRRIRNLPLDKYRVIYNGADTEHFNRRRISSSRREILGLPVDAFVIGSVGRLHAQKAFATLIEAYAIVARRLGNVKLVIAGDGAQRAELEQLAGDLGVAGGVVFLGLREDIPEVLSCLDVFALASLYEGHPNAVVQAMSMELPVVMTDIPPAHDVLIPGETGVIVASSCPVCRYA